MKRILDAAAELIAEVGVDGASTNLIAVRARTSVGSLYQFFPNRESIVHALAARYATEFERVKELAMPLEVAHRPLLDMMRGIIGPIAAFCHANPAYRHIYAADGDAGVPSAGEARLHAGVVERVEALIAHRTPWIGRVQRRTTAVVQVQAVHAVVFHSLSLGRAERARVIEELARTLACALEPFDRASPRTRARR